MSHITSILSATTTTHLHSARQHYLTISRIHLWSEPKIHHNGISTEFVMKGVM